MMARALALALIAVLVVAGCGVEPVVAPAPPVIDGLAGWHTNLGATTCADYTQSMTPPQQLAAAKWMLATERTIEVSDASDGAEFAPAFAVQVAIACAKYYGSAPTTGVIAGAGMAYHDDPSLHPAHH